MHDQMGRRSFLKTAGIVAAGVSLSGLSPYPVLAAKPLAKGAPRAEKLGWRLGPQAYSFRKFSFFDAIDKTASLGLRYIEAYPGQRVDKKKNVKMGVDLSKDVLRQIQKRLDDAGIKMVNYGVCKLDGDENKARKTYDFAKTMGIETLVAEPPEDAFDTLDKLCNEYKINLAIHNHPTPSHYWDYRTVLKVCKDRSKRIGACCDTGHWMRSKIDPLEALKKLEGRIISFHLKDLKEFGKRKAKDVPWGTGVGKTRELLEEVLRQKVRCFFAIEYEQANPELLHNMAKCVNYFDATAAELAPKPSKKPVV